MKKITLNFLSKSFFTLLFLAVIGVTANVSAAAKTAIQNGNWNATSTWTGGVVPGATDDVTITGFTVTVTDTQTAQSVTVQSDATQAGKLIVETAGSLTASTAVATGNSLILKGGEVENAGSINLLTTSGVCIQYSNTNASMFVTSGKYSGAGSLSLNCSANTSGSAITMAQSQTIATTPTTYIGGVFTVGGDYTFNIASGRPIFNIGVGRPTIDGTGTISVGSIASPVSHGLIMITTDYGRLTINPNVTLSIVSNMAVDKRGPIYIHNIPNATLINKGIININGSGNNAIGAAPGTNANSSIINEGTININGTYLQSFIGINSSTTASLNFTNTGTINVTAGNATVPVLSAFGSSNKIVFTNNTNGILNISAGNAVVLSSVRSGIINSGGTLIASGILNGTLDASTGTIQPGGNIIGKLTISQLQLAAASTNNLTGKCMMNINGKTTAGTDFDQIVFSQATVDVSGATLQVNVGGGYTPADNDAVSLFTAGATRSNNFSAVTLPSLNWSMDYATTNAAKVKYSSVAANTIASGNTVIISENTTVSDLTINTGGALTVNAGKQLTVSSTMSNSGTLNLLSTSSDGTATILTPTTIGGTGATYNVQQYISSTQTGVNGRNWYISSPLSAATSSSITTATGNGLVYYDGTTPWANAGTTMDVMKGYIAKSPAQNTTINFTGGTLNTGDKSVTNLPLGFNLVGNPYASSVDFAQAVIASTNVTNSIWYRSKKSNSYNFHTYNVTGGVSVHDGTAIIAPMQAFWIKTTSATNSFGFTNNMRSHQDQSVVANRLMVPKVNTQPLLRLQVSNATNRDETVVYFNPNAQNAVDDYDTQKMFNNISDVPEIYTQNGTSKLVINGMNFIPFETEIPLGFTSGEVGNFSISATEFKNFEAGTKLMLLDKSNPNTETNLSEGQSYAFNSIAVNDANRFSLLFRAPGATTGVKELGKNNAQVFVNAANQITIIATEKSNYAIYNAVGQKVNEMLFNSSNYTDNTIYKSGIYVVVIALNGQKETHKVVIR